MANLATLVSRRGLKAMCTAGSRHLGYLQYQQYQSHLIPVLIPKIHVRERLIDMIIGQFANLREEEVDFLWLPLTPHVISGQNVEDIRLFVSR